MHHELTSTPHCVLGSNNAPNSMLSFFCLWSFFAHRASSIRLDILKSSAQQHVQNRMHLDPCVLMQTQLASSNALMCHSISCDCLWFVPRKGDSEPSVPQENDQRSPLFLVSPKVLLEQVSLNVNTLECGGINRSNSEASLTITGLR